MPRRRELDPKFFTNDILADLELRTQLPVRLAYAGLWCVADRDGRFEWKPRTLKLDILPWDSVDFGEVLEALVEAGFVRRYEIKGVAYGDIPTFAKHQRPHPREAKSKLPQYVASEGQPKANPGRSNGKPKASLGSAKSVGPSSPSSPSSLSGPSDPQPTLSDPSGSDPPAPSWVAEATAMFATDVGRLRHGRIGKALKPLVDAVGWDVPHDSPKGHPEHVRRWWGNYCRLRKIRHLKPGDPPDTRFCSPEDFVAHYVEWRDLAQPMDP